MSKERLVWLEKEKDLLIRARKQMPRATTDEITQIFNMRNHRERSYVAVRTKLRHLGMSSRALSRARFPTIPKTWSGQDLLDRSRVNLRDSMKSYKENQRTHSRPLVRYDLGILELGIFVPLHPLLAEARQHATNPQKPGHCEDSSAALPWPSTLGNDAISKLKCGEMDKIVLQQYMGYLEDLSQNRKKNIQPRANNM